MSPYSNKEIEKNKRFSIINGTYSAISQNIYSSFLALFAIQALGASNQQIGLINSLPQIMNLIAMIPGAILINRLLTKKNFVAKSLFAARFFLLIIALIPFIPGVNQAWLLVMAVALMGLPVSLANLSWQSFIGDLIPQEQRSSFFGKRNRYNTIAAMLSILSVGTILSLFDKSNPLPYQVFFFIAFLMGLMEVLYLYRHIEKKKKRQIVDKGKGKFFRFFPVLVKEKPFLLFVSCSLLFNFGWQMAWPLFSIYNIQYAHANAIWLSLFTVISQIAQILSFPFWARLADRYGNMFVLFIVCAGMGLAPTLTILSTNLYYLLLTNLISGLFLSGISMLLFNQMLNVSPEEGRTSFIAAYNIVIGLVGFIAPQFGVWLLDEIGMNLTMNLSTLLRLVGALSFLAVVLLFEKRN